MTDDQTNKLINAYVKLVRISNHVVMPRALKAMMEAPLGEIREALQSDTRKATDDSNRLVAKQQEG